MGGWRRARRAERTGGGRERQEQASRIAREKKEDGEGNLQE
jgi:hypothetical protein